MYCPSCRTHVHAGHQCENGSSEYDNRKPRQFSSVKAFCWNDCTACDDGCAFHDLKSKDTESDTEYYG